MIKKTIYTMTFLMVLLIGFGIFAIPQVKGYKMYRTSNGIGIELFLAISDGMVNFLSQQNGVLSVEVREGNDPLTTIILDGDVWDWNEATELAETKIRYWEMTLEMNRAMQQNYPDGKPAPICVIDEATGVKVGLYVDSAYSLTDLKSVPNDVRCP